MKRQTEKMNTGALVTMLVFAVFAVCVLALLFSGAGVYKRITAADTASSDRRTATQYVLTRLRGAESAGAVSIESFGGTDALVIADEIDGEIYLTRIYCSDGWLRELFSSSDAELTPAAGEKVLKAEELKLSLDKGLLSISITLPDNNSAEAVFALIQGEGAAA